MSDSRAKNNQIKMRGHIQPPNGIKELTEYNSRKCLTPSTELLIEFLSAVMTKDYELALRHCTEILNREPNNLTALEFYPLIVEKLEMIHNEELESSSTESSSSASSTTSSSSQSETNLFEGDFIEKSSLYEWGKSHTSCSEQMSVENLKESAVSNPSTLEEETANEKSKPMESNISLQAKPKKTFLPNLQFKKKKTENEEPLPSNLLIHPTQTITLLGNDASNKETKTPACKQEKRTPNAQQEQLPSKILLHTTPTITFPKRIPPQHLERTGIPQ